MYGSPLKAFAALRVTSDKVFITNGDDFHSPTEEGGRQLRVSVFFESLRARETAWATNLPFDDGRVVTPSLLASPHLQMTLLAFIVQFEEKGSPEIVDAYPYFPLEPTVNFILQTCRLNWQPHQLCNSKAQSAEQVR